MPQKFLLILLIILTSSCRKGYGICLSDKNNLQFDCSYSKGKGYVVSYSQAETMSVYSDHDFQKIADYCADRSLPKPAFTECFVDAKMEVFHCGLSDVKFNESDGFTGLSEVDNTALMASCNIDTN